MKLDTNYARILGHQLSIAATTFLPFFPHLRPSIAIEPKKASITADPTQLKIRLLSVIVTILIIPARSYFCSIDTGGTITAFLLSILPFAILYDNSIAIYVGAKPIANHIIFSNILLIEINCLRMSY